MRLADLRVNPRLRSTAEATDLGVVILRTWMGPVARAWAVTVLPWMGVCLGIALFRPWLAVLLLWLAKPLYDRVVVWVLGRSIFGATPSVAATLRHLPALWSAGSVWALTLGRLSPNRAITVPVGVLEGVTGAARRRREAVLAGGVENGAPWVAMICLGVEGAVATGLLTLMSWFLPDSPRWTVAVVSEELWDGTAPPAIFGAVLVGWCAAMSVTEPLFAAAGFGLYLNRRTRVEGWDLDVAFRQIARRLGGVAALLLALLAATGAARAETPDPAQVAEEVVAGDDFPHPHVVRRLRWKDQAAPEASTSDGCGDSTTTDAPPAMVAPAASCAQGTLTVGVAVLLASLLFAVVRRREGTADVSLPKEPATEHRVGVRPPEDGVEDLAAQAWALFTAGRPAEAIGLLYTDGVGRFVRDGVAIEAGATEGECLRAVQRRMGGDIVPWFRELVGARRAVTYAHREVDSATMRRLCDGWRAAFGGAP